MKGYSPQMQVLTFLAILFWTTSCNGPTKKELTKEKEHSKLIKTAGNGNVSCGIQDKAGNLWFGTSDNGLWTLFEDKTGRLWVGTRETSLYLFNGKTFINYSGS